MVIAKGLVLIVNNRKNLQVQLNAARHALRSYEFGNAAPDLARWIADAARRC